VHELVYTIAHEVARFLDGECSLTVNRSLLIARFSSLSSSHRFLLLISFFFSSLSGHSAGGGGRGQGWRDTHMLLLQVITTNFRIDSLHAPQSTH
jgi:hypothetical protein